MRSHPPCDVLPEPLGPGSALPDVVGVGGAARRLDVLVVRLVLRRVGGHDRERAGLRHRDVLRSGLIGVAEPSRVSLATRQPQATRLPHQVVERHQGMARLAGILDLGLAAGPADGVVDPAGEAIGEVPVGRLRQVHVGTVAGELALVPVLHGLRHGVRQKALTFGADGDGRKQGVRAWAPDRGRRVQDGESEAVALVVPEIELPADVHGPRLRDVLQDPRELVLGDCLAPRVEVQTDLVLQHEPSSGSGFAGLANVLLFIP